MRSVPLNHKTARRLGPTASPNGEHKSGVAPHAFGCPASLGGVCVLVVPLGAVVVAVVLLVAVAVAAVVVAVAVATVLAATAAATTPDATTTTPMWPRLVGLRTACGATPDLCSPIGLAAGPKRRAVL